MAKIISLTRLSKVRKELKYWTNEVPMRRRHALLMCRMVPNWNEIDGEKRISINAYCEAKRWKHHYYSIIAGSIPTKMSNGYAIKT